MEAMGHSSMTVTDYHVREANKKRIAVDIARAINQREEKRDRKKRRGARRAMTKAILARVSRAWTKRGKVWAKPYFFSMKSEVTVGPEDVWKERG
ncbi:hypothetical protein [Mesorhizobium sp.]|uniref:hypothetical protein n=1 Tax=Mesorhizobium sp. TaxID=1871066 RepID=UPI0025C65162|nr:hypothetical protein [Mesorhizobium sp.]